MIAAMGVALVDATASHPAFSTVYFLHRGINKSELTLYQNKLTKQKQQQGKKKMETDVTPLSQLRPGIYNYKVRVRVSRMWEFHGKNDDEPLKHLDMVVIDQNGTAMYIEIPPQAVPPLQPHLEEGKVVTMTKISIHRAKPSFKAVRGPYFIRLNKWSAVREVNPEPPNFPKYTFYLTPFAQLPQLQGNNEYFIDVTGRIVALSDATPVSTSIGQVRMKRLIHLMDVHGNKVEVSLWGPRAEEFQGDQVFEAGRTNHVIAIFVGTSVKSYSGSPPFLSGTSACRWYINVQEIPEICAFYRSIGQEAQPIQKIQLQTASETQNLIEQKILIELKSIDPFENLTKRFQCTITITKLAENQPWCYLGCTTCNSSALFEGSSYICKKGHVASHIINRYRISLYATDGTWELEFILFDDRASSLVGKPAERLLKHHNKYELPPEIEALVGEKVTVVIKIFPGKSIDSKQANKSDEAPTFEILSVQKRHGKDLTTFAFNNEQPSTLLPATPTEFQNLPPLVPIHLTKEGTQKPSASQAAETHDLQLMDIDQKSTMYDLTLTHKRGYNTTQTDSDEEYPGDPDQTSFSTTRGKRKKD